jgi:RecB family exonuclease
MTTATPRKRAAKKAPDKPEHKLTYDDTTHAYYLNGRRCKSVSTVAKVPTDTYTLEKWSQRMVAIGLATDPQLIENVAAHIDNRDRLDEIVEQAKRAAKAHQAADRGTQMHRVLELVLLGQDDKLLTAQQRADAEVLKRTLDRYKLTPHQDMAEQFVIWPQHTIAGRFDAILEQPDGTLILTDLKSGPNAVTYPQSVSIQLALYARAPMMSSGIHTAGDRATITDWRELPERLDRLNGYVLLVTPDDTVGTLHRIDIEHGWAAAQLALQVVDWRKGANYGRDIASKVAEFTQRPAAPTWESLIRDATSVEDLRLIWKRAKELGELTGGLKVLAARRSEELGG